MFSTLGGRKIFLKQDIDKIFLESDQARIDASNKLRFMSLRPQNPFLIWKTCTPPINAGLGRRFFIYAKKINLKKQVIFQDKNSKKY